MIEIHQTLAILLVIVAVIVIPAAVLFAVYLFFRTHRIDDAVYVPVSAFQDYLHFEEEQENYDECAKIKNLIKGKEEYEEVLLPEGYAVIESSLYDKNLKMSKHHIIYKLDEV